MTIAAEAGISAETMADCYIPIVARELGEAWCVDELGFADVTIGSARLQAMLRELGPEWTAGQTMQPDASTVLLLVPEGQYHTLGAMILSGQLRRVGLSVRLVLGASTSDVKNILEMADFDAVFISAVRGVSLEILRKIVNCIHVSRGTNTPVVVGGTALELHDDIVSLTGADYVTNSADEAISLCNLRTRPRPVIVMDK